VVKSSCLLFLPFLPLGAAASTPIAAPASPGGDAAPRAPLAPHVGAVGAGPPASLTSLPASSGAFQPDAYPILARCANDMAGLAPEPEPDDSALHHRTSHHAVSSGHLGLLAGVSASLCVQHKYLQVHSQYHRVMWAV
jgi:hypothetical protein